MQEKRCTKCDDCKPVSDFNLRNKLRGIRNSHCRECTKRASKIAYRKRRRYYIKSNVILRNNRKKRLLKFLFSYFEANPCADCGISDPLVLQFDHVRGEKKRNIATMLALGMDILAVKSELRKCEVRCANCHLKKTARENNYYMHVMQTKNVEC